MERVDPRPTLDTLAAASVAALLDASATQPLSSATRLSLAYMTRHYGDRVRLADLAAASGETPFQLIRVFRRDIGTTPHAFLVRVRVAIAAALLTAGEPIAAIATAVGFVDQAHFTRHFKRLHGRTPARQRAAIRADATGGRYAAATC
jgi:transcriptional regulator GlxA family with amidase domain